MRQYNAPPHFHPIHPFHLFILSQSDWNCRTRLSTSCAWLAAIFALCQWIVMRQIAEWLRGLMGAGGVEWAVQWVALSMASKWGAMAVEPPRLALSVAKATNCEHRWRSFCTSCLLKVFLHRAKLVADRRGKHLKPKLNLSEKLKNEVFALHYWFDNTSNSFKCAWIFVQCRILCWPCLRVICVYTNGALSRQSWRRRKFRGRSDKLNQT